MEKSLHSRTCKPPQIILYHILVLAHWSSQHHSQFDESKSSRPHKIWIWGTQWPLPLPVNTYCITRNKMFGAHQTKQKTIIGSACWSSPLYRTSIKMLLMLQSSHAKHRHRANHTMSFQHHILLLTVSATDCLLIASKQLQDTITHIQNQ